jgi:hypothetical protein
MAIFDLVFLVVLLCVLLALGAAAYAAVRRRFGRALALLRGVGICAVLYVAIVAVVSLIAPARVLHVGETHCFDDWCIAVAKVHEVPRQYGTASAVDIVLSSRMRRRPQREYDLVVALVDQSGREYAPTPGQSGTPFDVVLQPEQSITTTRVFELPPNARAAGLVMHHAGLRPELLIIGNDESLFHKKMIVRFD